MANRQLETVQFDRTGGAGDDDLIDAILPVDLKFQAATFQIDNRGTGDAYVIVTEDLTGTTKQTAIKISPGESKGVGEYSKGFVPILSSELGANCFVTTVVR